ncbi:MAG: ZIP family metal transporter [Deltaproteobacteria bacterium]|nr:ZIP family metal transporter [Deltaproteobacteria bacterium]
MNTTLGFIGLFAIGVIASFTASLGTGIGAIPVFFIRNVSQRNQDFLLSLAAGIMLAASIYSLVEPGVAAAILQVGSKNLATAIFGLSILTGAYAILLVHRHLPHEHFFAAQTDTTQSDKLRRVWLLVMAITLHNFPEGMAVGVGFGGEINDGFALMTGIFIQNLPEGFVVALALLTQGHSQSRAVAIASATGLVETIGGIFGAAAVTIVSATLPWAMGFAAGAMLFVISHEIIPETHRNGFETNATFGVITGFIGMLLINSLFS